MKSVLRWAGSKQQLLPKIGEYWDKTFVRYVEPFCGSASLFFSVQPERALLSDLNGELIDTLVQLQLSGDRVSECLSRLPLGSRNYYQIRKISPEDISPAERAARFIYLNMLCFNGLYRVNREGRFNVPYGRKQRENFNDPAFLREASYALRKATIQQADFESIVDQTTFGDFLYLDPPYATSSARVFVEYGKNAFRSTDLKRLLAALRRAEQRGARFVLSYSDVPEIRKLPTRWRVARVTVKRNIAGFVDSRRRAREVLISNIGN